MADNTYTATLEFDGAYWDVKVKLGERDYGERYNRTKGRLFIWGQPGPEHTSDPIAHPPYSTQCREAKKEGHDKKACEQCQQDKAWRKYNRREIEIMKHFAKAAIKPLGIEVQNFSRTAGCSCPCSPGFILDDSRGPVNVYMTVAESMEVAA